MRSFSQNFIVNPTWFENLLWINVLLPKELLRNLGFKDVTFWRRSARFLGAARVLGAFPTEISNISVLFQVVVGKKKKENPLRSGIGFLSTAELRFLYQIQSYGDWGFFEYHRLFLKC